MEVSGSVVRRDVRTETILGLFVVHRQHLCFLSFLVRRASGPAMDEGRLLVFVALPIVPAPAHSQ